MPIQTVVCGGGLNTEALITDMKPGEALALLNVEVDVSGSYTTMAGIEPFDGRLEPNKANYKILKLASVTGITLGAVITATSGWTARVVGIDGNEVAVIDPNGPLTLADSVEGNAIQALPIDAEASTYELHKQTRKYAEGYYRSLIQAVPGMGPVRGIVIYKGAIYAFRDHTDFATCRMYKASASGWVLIPTSGFLLKDGTYGFSIHNFNAGAGTKKLVIVNGVNKACIYDGTTVSQISTGMTVDKPSSVEVLPSSVLLLGFDNGSLMTSGPGTPTDFTVGSGGAEIGMSDKIIGLALQPDERVAVFCEQSIRILTGKTIATYATSIFNDEAGAVRGSIGNIGDSIFLSQSGLTRLSRTQTYGSFEMTGLDQKVKSLIVNSDVLFSVVVRNKNQYRLFYSGGFLGFTMSGQDVIGSFTGKYPTKMACGYSAEIANEEYVLLGGEDGFVYRADVGTSHAGESYSRLARLAHNDLRSPQQRKKFKRLTINADSQRYEPISVAVTLDYSSPDALRQSPADIFVGGAESYYGTAIFGESVFGSADDAINQIYLSGVGRSLSVTMLINSDTCTPVRFGGYSIEYMNRAKTR
ncbi:MAG TPA: hypothetical protein VN030_11560 [Cellvibrio sp.]|nr:hypothetical protein [Cellvibrio sp.]